MSSVGPSSIGAGGVPPPPPPKPVAGRASTKITELAKGIENIRWATPGLSPTSSPVDGRSRSNSFSQQGSSSDEEVPPPPPLFQSPSSGEIPPPPAYPPPPRTPPPIPIIYRVKRADIPPPFSNPAPPPLSITSASASTSSSSILGKITSLIRSTPEEKRDKILSKLTTIEAAIVKGVSPDELKKLAASYNQVKGKVAANSDLNVQTVKEALDRVESHFIRESLEFVLTNRETDSHRHFEQFLTRGQAVENMQFFNAVDDYLKNPTEAACSTIIANFINNKAEKMINISDSNRNAFLPATSDVISRGKHDKMKEALKMARNEIFQLMHNDPFVRFVAITENRNHIKNDLGIR